MKIAVFGKPGGGKSTLSQQIASVTNLPLHQLDLIQFLEGGARVPDEVFLKLHAGILANPDWVIDGFGTPRSFGDLLGAADVLVYVERAAIVHYWWVTKRFILSPFSKPLGWPARSPMLRSTMSSYRFLRLSSRFWTPAFRARLLALQPGKRVYIVRRQPEVGAMLNELKRLAVCCDA
jgi:adenylate kinase family enzyme